MIHFKYLPLTPSTYNSSTQYVQYVNPVQYVTRDDLLLPTSSFSSKHFPGPKRTFHYTGPVLTTMVTSWSCISRGLIERTRPLRSVSGNFSMWSPKFEHYSTSLPVCKCCTVRTIMPKRRLDSIHSFVGLDCC